MHVHFTAQKGRRVSIRVAWCCLGGTLPGGLDTALRNTFMSWGAFKGRLQQLGQGHWNWFIIKTLNMQINTLVFAISLIEENK